MRRPLLLSFAALFLSTLACGGGRDPGPLESEWGKVLFWEVVAVDATASSCTNAPEFVDATAPPVLEPNTFFMVEVSRDGKTAVAMDCTETRADSCTPLPDFVFTVERHMLHYDEPKLLVESTPDCSVSLASHWTVVDNGDEGLLEVLVTFPFDGDPAGCDSLDDAIASQGANGVGLIDCSATMLADLEFYAAD